MTPRTASYALAVCYRELGIPEGYEDSLVYTLQFDPKMPEANYDYGMLLLKKVDVAGAAEHFRRSADAAPGVDKPQIELDKLGNPDDRLAEAVKEKTSNPARALVECTRGGGARPGIGRCACPCRPTV